MGAAESELEVGLQKESRFFRDLICGDCADFHERINKLRTFRRKKIKI